MKIIIISDTHMPKMQKKLPSRLTQELESADYIIHAGDWATSDVYDILEAYAPVKGVYGNVDGEQVRARFPSKRILELNGYRIGIVHGHGQGKTTERRAIDTFTNDSVNIIVFGHSHIPLLRYFKKQLLINPGSPTDKRTNPYYSFAILELGEDVRAEHVFFRDK